MPALACTILALCACTLVVPAYFLGRRSAFRSRDRLDQQGVMDIPETIAKAILARGPVERVEFAIGLDRILRLRIAGEERMTLPGSMVEYIPAIIDEIEQRS